MKQSYSECINHIRNPEHRHVASKFRIGNHNSVNFKSPSTFLSKAENDLSKHLKNHQLNLIRTNKKLKFYFVFKNETNYSQTEFINHIRNPEHKRVASKFRIGNHNLKIETGRFTILKTPEDPRICDHCNQNSVENELHIIFHCDLYHDLRKTLYNKNQRPKYTIYKLQYP